MKGDDKGMEKHQTRECSIKELDLKLREIIKPYISDGEKILLCFETGPIEEEDTRSAISKFFSSELPDDFRSTSILTNIKIIYASRNPRFGNDGNVITLDLNDISGITEESTSGHGYSSCSVTANITNGRPTGVGSFSGAHKVNMSRKFTDAIRQELQKARTSSASENSKSVEERLRTLTNLHKEGLVSEAEFQQKRKEILGQL